MNIDEIIETNKTLNKQLTFALATMERKDTIKDIRLQIIANQQKCPHTSTKYGWEVKNNTCPYCGFVFGKGRDY